MASSYMPEDGEVPGDTGGFCKVNVPVHFSGGLWNSVEATNILNYTLPRVYVQLIIIFLLTQGFHTVLRRIYVPRLVSEILAGVILGQSFLGQFFPKAEKALFPIEGDIFIQLLSKIGYMFFQFLIGLQMDPRMVFKTGIKSWTIALIGVVLPNVFAILAGSLASDNLNDYRKPAVENISKVLAITPFPVVAALLIDLKIMNSELGRLVLSSTLIMELLNLMFSVYFSNIRVAAAANLSSVTTKSAFLTIALVLLLVFGTPPISSFIIKRTPEGKPVKRAYIILVTFMVLSSAILADNAGLQYQLGPFIIGLCMPDGPPLGSALVERFETLTSGLFLPLIFTYCGLKVNLSVAYDLQFIGILALIILSSVIVKFVVTFCPALACKMSYRDASVLAFIMCSQGIVQISIFMNLFDNQTLDNDGFSIVTIAVLIMAMSTSVFVRMTYDYSRTYTGYQKRNILHSSNHAELRVLTCAHRQDDAMAALKLIEASNPTTESPFSVYGLNLVELVGRATPLLINHKLGQKASSGGSRSQQMIELFSQFELRHQGAITTQVFTAMSLPKFMYHDICSFAFDKSVSLILLPFHQKWNSQGKVVFNSPILRTINCEVLENSPCSVGILIDRRKVRPEGTEEEPQPERQSSRFLVAVVFLGGNDDREALALGKRMAKTSGVHLTVVRLVAWDEDPAAEPKQWDSVLDTDMLKDIRLQSLSQENITYREEKVKDGPDTAMIIHAMEDVFDLIIVGRHHKDGIPLLSGLTEWNDLPELGPVGDMLAAADIRRPVSVLVLQQQLKRKSNRT